MSSLPKFLSRSFSWLIAVFWFLCRALLIAWATLAIYYSNLPLAGLRLGLAGTFAAFAIWALWMLRPSVDHQAAVCVARSGASDVALVVRSAIPLIRQATITSSITRQSG